MAIINNLNRRRALNLETRIHERLPHTTFFSENSYLLFLFICLFVCLFFLVNQVLTAIARNACGNDVCPKGEVDRMAKCCL